MARYIDADAFEKQLNRYVEYNDDGKQEINADEVFITLHEQPTAYVVERKMGEWKVCDILDYAQRPTGRKILRCPFCEYLSDEFMSRVDYYRALTNFCPNCGADMRKEVER